MSRTMTIEHTHALHPFFSNKASTTSQAKVLDCHTVSQGGRNNDEAGDTSTAGNGVPENPSSVPVLADRAKRTACVEKSQTEPASNHAAKKRRISQSTRRPIAVSQEERSAIGASTTHLITQDGRNEERESSPLVVIQAVRTPEKRVKPDSAAVSRLVDEHGAHVIVPAPSTPERVPESSPQPQEQSPSENEHANTGTVQSAVQERMLTLKNGKFPSPKAKRQRAEGTAASSSKKRAKAKNSSIVTLKYDITRLKGHIEAILQKQPQPASPTANTPRKRRAITSKEIGPAKPAHPFFSGKAGKRGLAKSDETNSANVKIAAAVDPNALPSPRRASAVTPGKLRAEVAAHRSTLRQPAFGQSNAHRPPAFTRQAGLKEPSWPSTLNRHVRGLSPTGNLHLSALESGVEVIGRSKGKRIAIQVPLEENVVTLNRPRLFRSSETLFDQHIKFTGTKGNHDSHFPKRKLLSGKALREETKIYKGMRGRVSKASSPSFSPIYRSTPPGLHPALRDVFQRFENYLSPFDCCDCERQAWPQKYSPTRAELVLQTGPEATILRDWLRESTVNSVRMSSKRSNASVGSSTMKSRFSKIKKRKRPEDLDDFVVSDVEEGDQLEELIEVEDSPHHCDDNTSKSLVRGGFPAARSKVKKRLASTVLMSGPHGCGKTAAVYAVAKELGFEVFEINPGTRRSGRDILDRIGDMTENHLVQQVSKALSGSNPDEAVKAINVDDQTMNPDPKQNKLNSFFKSADKSMLGSKTLIKKDATSDAPEGQRTAMRPSQQQKQSLILFEEVDVLFEEDKNFWLTVLTIANNSKRPIVMTCTNENLVPIESFTFHAMLRFKSPPLDLAVDYLLLLAGREGHILERSAVETLYISRNRDLRGSIAELDFWCQFGVGDSRGGLDWLYQRWPPGSDRDAHGQQLRVTSENTFRTGHGWFDHSEKDPTFETRLDLLQHLRSEWNVGVNDLGQQCWQGYSRGTSPAAIIDQTDLSLASFAFRAEFLSAADLYCDYGQTQDSLLGLLDTDVPEANDKYRANFVTGATLIQDDPLIDYSRFRAQLTSHALSVASSHWIRSRPSRDQSTTGPDTPLMSVDEDAINTVLTAKARQSEDMHLSRKQLSEAFDALAEAPGPATAQSSIYLQYSSFDREFNVITTDLAPYIRIIACFDLELESQRLQLSNLLSEGSQGLDKKSKKRRTTRASRSALEGGRREETRRERWFEADVNLRLCLQTAGKDWAGLGARKLDELRSFAERHLDDASVRSTDDELALSQ